ncbi:hypothetical protein XM38_005230 [Halomicronema hongdechloris C2206]|uniref:HTH OST-type domain-containing protein n=1 Tax=Halomicronema hongdechloris C2206 TaxID=1641165 RepID=A0A1Z3HH26_9CYAN|nr:DUF3825 domain-containing protein [Halomicronema hongdechloris]ASC69596.1 hypothetical protein XM38_005230 [Halomicronema hongdechloris C2206]
MISLLKRLLNWIKTLLGLNRSERRSSGPNRLPKPHPKTSQHAGGNDVNSQSTSSPATDISFPAKLRRTLYQSFYALDRGDDWIDLAPLGNAIKQQDPTFSVAQYNYGRLSELLEAAADLVELDRPNNRARLRNPANIKAFLIKAFSDISSNDGWIHLASVGHQVNQLNPEFSASKYGFRKFREFIESCSDLIDLKKDDSVYPSRYYVRLRQPKTPPKVPGKSSESTKLPSPRRPKPKSRQPDIVRLLSYAFFPNLEDAYHQLADLALPEKWYFGSVPPRGFRYPILRNYLDYTFIRLQYENKVTTSPKGDYSAFNTGLVDRKYEFIYALFGRDTYGRPQDWYLINFCILGEGREGKTLAAEFGVLPSANYFNQPADIFYDSHAGAPQVDWRHIIQDNSDRLPLKFLQDNCPQGFVPQDVRNVSSEAKAHYRQQFSDALSADPQAYRTIVSRCESALHFALLKTQLNYRTAIPYYNPRKNRLQLMLPLSLMRDDAVDCALVVERESSADPYIGHTILPLIWAYKNARLIGRLEEPWLRTSLISGSEDATFDTDTDLDDEEDD